ncbi:hypothetical protein PFISCL1PPCAC_6259 [Pristionchus fissidentatus]|uniref:Uncharacterized protein n=1 Tax=Pristionchus fissidentatus TaxID=1538716 RepID=A0AAV5V5T2_9BILA|nr:hypothetical protein PFISCL1PPCAC_6259 [Pristionchus fissidentatus]
MVELTVVPTLYQMDLFLLELWRGDGLSAVRAYVPPQSEDLINDDGIPQFVMQFSHAIKDLVDWERERLIYRDSDDENICIEGVSGDGIMESVVDALSHWPFIYKVQYSVVPRPSLRSIRSEIVDEFPDVSFPELTKKQPCLIVAKKEEPRKEEISIQRMSPNETFHDFLLELEKRQDEIQQTLRRESFSTPSLCPSALPSDVLESIANDSTMKRIVPGTPLEDSRIEVTDELNELAERVERQLSLLNENSTATTQTEDQWKVEEVSQKKDGRIAKYKGTKTVDAKKPKKNSIDTKVVILKMGKCTRDLHRSDDSDEAIYCQSVRVMNLSRNPVQAKIVVSRRSPGAKPILYRDFVYLQPYVPTKFSIGLVDDLSEETSYITYSLHLFNTPISPPISIFSPPSSSLIPTSHHFSRDTVVSHHRSIPSPPSLIPLPPTVLPSLALPAPPRVEALAAPPEIFTSETLRGMISRKNSQEEEPESVQVENVVDEIVNGAIQNAQKEEGTRTPMLIIEETAEEIDEKEREEGGEVEEAEECKAEESDDDDDSESISDVEEINVDDDSEADSDFEVIQKEEEEH